MFPRSFFHDPEHLLRNSYLVHDEPFRVNYSG